MLTRKESQHLWRLEINRDGAVSSYWIQCGLSPLSVYFCSFAFTCSLPNVSELAAHSPQDMSFLFLIIVALPVFSAFLSVKGFPVYQ